MLIKAPSTARSFTTQSGISIVDKMDGRKQPGLANQTLLNKIDKLRELNVGSIELPQVCIFHNHGTPHPFTNVV
jgi:hypothetical protein